MGTGTGMSGELERKAQSNGAQIEGSERQRRFLAAIVSRTPDLIYGFDRNYRFIFANEALLQMWGKSFDDAIGKTLIENGYERWHAEMHEREMDRVVATKKSIRGEASFPHATLGQRVYDYFFVPVMNAAGEVESIAGTTRDITEMKREEQQRSLLLDELNHRVKNTLATVQSLALQTMRSTSAPAEFQKAFTSRLMALSRAHDLLTRGHWQGTSLGDVVRQTLQPYEEGVERRIALVGPEVMLGPSAGIMLNLILHEMATNAAKYGALSTPDGKVSVTWAELVADGFRQAELLWSESDGPPVAPPARCGFGMRLIERGIREELDGEVDLRFDPAGVRCHIRLPFEKNVV
jgi:PAS domain S-box-containing protein